MLRLGGKWVSASPGWVLVDARNGRTVDPPALVCDEKMETTPWELRSFAVQLARDQWADAGRQLMWWNDNPDVNPSVWSVGDSGPEWVVVAAARYPDGDEPMLLYRGYEMQLAYGGLEGEGGGLAS